MPTPEVIKAPTKQIRLLLRRMRLRRNGATVDLDVTKMRLGPTGMADAPMAIHPDPINDRSVVYSFGVGRNLAWDVEMIRHFGVTIHAFDPTPGAVEWATTTRLPENVHFHPVGAAVTSSRATSSAKPCPPRSSIGSSI